MSNRNDRDPNVGRYEYAIIETATGKEVQRVRADIYMDVMPKSDYHFKEGYHYEEIPPPPPAKQDRSFFYFQSMQHLLVSDLDEDGYFRVELDCPFSTAKRVTRVFHVDEDPLGWILREQRKYLKKRLKAIHGKTKVGNVS